MLVTRGQFGRFPHRKLNQWQEIDYKPNFKIFRRAISNEEYNVKKVKGRITRPQNKSIVHDFCSVSYHLLYFKSCSSFSTVILNRNKRGKMISTRPPPQPKTVTLFMVSNLSPLIHKNIVDKDLYCIYIPELCANLLIKGIEAR